MTDTAASRTAAALHAAVAAPGDRTAAEARFPEALNAYTGDA